MCEGLCRVLFTLLRFWFSLSITKSITYFNPVLPNLFLYIHPALIFHQHSNRAFSTTTSIPYICKSESSFSVNSSNFYQNKSGSSVNNSTHSSQQQQQQRQISPSHRTVQTSSHVPQKKNYVDDACWHSNSSSDWRPAVNQARKRSYTHIARLEVLLPQIHKLKGKCPDTAHGGDDDEEAGLKLRRKSNQDD